jgi:hypothetical protein
LEVEQAASAAEVEALRARHTWLSNAAVAPRLVGDWKACNVKEQRERLWHNLDFHPANRIDCGTH